MQVFGAARLSSKSTRAQHYVAVPNPRLSRPTNDHPGAKLIVLVPIQENPADTTSVACFLLMRL
jgi:hypothetical protein